MYIEQGSSPPPIDTNPSIATLGEEPRYPFTRRQKIAMRALSVFFGSEGAVGLAEGNYVTSGLAIGLSVGIAAVSKWGEWRDEEFASIFDAATGDRRDEYGQPLDNRGDF